MLICFARRVSRFIKKRRQFYRDPNIKIAKSAEVISHTNITCYNSAIIKIGENSLINEQCSIMAIDCDIQIGNEILVGPQTVINTGNYNFTRTDISIAKQGSNEKPITIEDDVWIGAHCTILGGVTIGAHSLVNKSIPPYSIAYGVPCKVTGTRNMKNNTQNKRNSP